MVRSKSVVRAGGANEAFTMSVKKFDLKCSSALSTRSVSSSSIYYCLIHNLQKKKQSYNFVYDLFSFSFFSRGGGR